MRVFLLVLALALSGCGGNGAKPAGKASGASGEPPAMFSQEWNKLAAENVASEEAKFLANKTKLGGVVQAGNLKIDEIAASREGDKIALVFKITNLSKSKVIEAGCVVLEAIDEHGNEFTHNDLPGLDFGKELQPGDSGMLKLLISPKLKTAKQAKIKLFALNGNNDEGEPDYVNWSLDFSIPAN